MDIVLWRMRIKDGKEERAQEWIAFLQEHQEEGNKTLKNEKEHLEIYFFNQENGAHMPICLYWPMTWTMPPRLQKTAAIHWMQNTWNT